MVAAFASRAIRWHRRLEARVLLTITLIAAVSLAALIVAADSVVTDHSLARSGEDLRAARVAFTRLVESRAQSAAKAARLVTELPTFQATLTDPRMRVDAPTVSATSADYCGKLGAVVCVVSDLNGSWMGQSGATPEAAAGLAPAIDAARAGSSFTDIVAVGDTLFLVVAEPVRFADEVLATFTAGYRLDDTVARELKVVTHVDVSFLCHSSDVCASSLSTALRKALSHALSSSPGAIGESNGPPALRELDGASYVGGMYPLRAGSQPGPQLVLLQDWSPTQQALRQVQSALLGVGSLTFVVALGATLLFSRQLTRPLRDLSSVANEVAGGNWARRVPVDGYAEARTMAEAFNHMTVTLSHWHEQARQQTAALHDAYGRFRSVTDSANDAIVSVNNRGEIVFWNPRAEAVFGYPETEAIGQPLSRLVPPDARHEYADQVARLMAEGGGSSRTIELSGMRRDGRQVPVELSLSTWKTGTEVFYTGVIRDITERLQTSHALREHEQQLRQVQKMEAVGRLAGGIAHDFNNLLTAILGYTDLLLERLAEDDPARADIVEIRAAGRNAASLTRDLLAFSRKQVLQPVVLDLNTVISATENLVRRLVGEQIELSIELASDLPPIKADRTQLAQVLINLAVNARDAMPDGGRLTIATESVADPGDAAGRDALDADATSVVLCVSDTGHGMSEDVVAQIFEPFFTTKETGKGTGLGLATVYGIVRQSGGHITVESAPGAGTTFRVSLPAIDSMITESGVGSDTPDSARGTELILLVEDNDAVRGLARESLTRYGYSVLDAGSGEAALAIAQTELPRISLVVTDIVMPGMSGRELARRLRVAREDLRIVFTSGYTNDMTLSPDEDQPGSVFLHKPFTPALLGRTVRELIDRPIPQAR